MDEREFFINTISRYLASADVARLQYAYPSRTKDPIHNIIGPHHRLFVVLSGSKHYHLSRDGHTVCDFVLHPGRILYLMPHGWIRPMFTTDFTYFYLNIYPDNFSLHWDQRQAGGSREFGPKIRLFCRRAPGPDVLSLLKILHKRGAQGDCTTIGPHLALSVFCLILDDLQQNPDSNARKAWQTWRALREYVEDHFFQPISRSSVADEFELSPNHVSKLFREEGGESFNTMLRRLRMQRADQLLLHTTMTIKEITHCCGFRDPSYFVRTFRKRCGQSPTAYRNRRREPEPNEE